MEVAPSQPCPLGLSDPAHSSQTCSRCGAWVTASRPMWEVRPPAKSSAGPTLPAATGFGPQAALCDWGRFRSCQTLFLNREQIQIFALIRAKHVSQ